MLEFLKRFGLGILYIVISPFLLLFLILWALYNVGIFFVEFFKGIGRFFKGEKFFAPFKEDVEAQKILNTYVPNNNPQPVVTPTPETPEVNNNGQ